MHDDYHDMKLATIFKKGVYKIVDIDAQMREPPTLFVGTLQRFIKT